MPDTLPAVRRASCQTDERVVTLYQLGILPFRRRVQDTVLCRSLPSSTLAVGNGQGRRLEVFHHRLRDPLLDVMPERPRAGIEEEHPVEVAQPQERVALPLLGISRGEMRQVVGMAIVAGHRLEPPSVGEAEHPLAIHQHLSVGQLHHLVYLACWQSVSHGPPSFLCLYRQHARHAQEV